MLTVIRKDAIEISGAPWLPKGESKVVGISSLVAKCLCKSHNSELSPLDAVAGKFFAALETSDLDRDGGDNHFLFSGHDIERWLLKTMAAMAHSENFARDGKKLTPVFDRRIDIPRMLENPSAWPLGTGIYSTQRVGDEFLRADAFGMAPLANARSGELIGLQLTMQGLKFDFFAVPPDNWNLVGDHRAYRPGSFTFRSSRVKNVVELSWCDGLKHGKIDAQLTATVGERLANRRELPAV